MTYVPVTHHHHLRHLKDDASRGALAREVVNGLATVIRMGRPVTYASNLHEVAKVLEDVINGKIKHVVVAWPGKTRQDVFELDELDAADMLDRIAPVLAQL
jgi:hypothetical protein